MSTTNVTSLGKDDVQRYSRQIILPEVGPEGQTGLSGAAVLIVGAGGLASSCGLYLAGAGIGRLGFVDFDVVEVSNLHRQIIHTTPRAGSPKVESAKASCLGLNPAIRVDAVHERFTAENGLALVKEYDVVVDATDNITARYLVNDACVLGGKPLVSGSALRWEGQLSVYNHDNGPCYRCAYPKPPPVHTVTSCADGGVIGAVPGTIGCLQAVEVQKIILGAGKTMSGRILHFNALEMAHTTMNQRPKAKGCAVCGENPTITKLSSYDEYSVKSCEIKPATLPAEVELSCEDFKKKLDAGDKMVVVDVRGENEYAICRLADTTNIPLARFEPATVAALRSDAAASDVPLVMLCRRGRASADATRRLIDAGVPNVRNVTSGLTRWAAVVDTDFPIY